MCVRERVVENGRSMKQEPSWSERKRGVCMQVREWKRRAGEWGKREGESEREVEIEVENGVKKRVRGGERERKGEITTWLWL